MRAARVQVAFFEEAVSTSNTKDLVSTTKLRRKATTFWFLDEDNANQHDGNDNCEYNENYVHIGFRLLLLINISNVIKIRLISKFGSIVKSEI